MEIGHIGGLQCPLSKNDDPRGTRRETEGGTRRDRTGGVYWGLRRRKEYVVFRMRDEWDRYRIPSPKV